MVKIHKLSDNCHSMLIDEIDFIYRGDALYWNPLAIETEEELRSVGAIRLEDVIEPNVKQISPNITEPYNLIELADIDGDTGLMKYREVMGHEIDSNKIKFKKGDVLFGKLRFYVKNIGIAPIDGIGSSEIIPLSSINTKFPSEYIFLFLRTKYVDHILSKRSKGSNHPRISDTDLYNLPILELPKEFIEKLIVKVQQAYQKYEEAQTLIKKATILIENQLGIKNEATSPKYSDFVHMNNDIDITKNLSVKYWGGEQEFFKDALRFKDVVHDVFAGKTPDWHQYSDDKGVRILKVRHLSNSGLAWGIKKRDFVHETFFQSHKEAEIQNDDLLIASAAHSAEYIGKDVSIVDTIPSEIGKAMASAKLNVIRPDRKKINPYVLLLYMQQQIFFNEIQRHITGQTAELYATDIYNNFPISIKLLNSNFKNASEVEELYKKALQLKRYSINTIILAIASIENCYDELLRT